MFKKLALTAALIIGTAGLALAHGPGGHGGPGGHVGIGHGGPGHVGVPGGHFGGPGHFGGRFGGGVGGGRFWHGRYWVYGVGPCWQLTPLGTYVWVCN